jgi:hypothetical protein
VLQAAERSNPQPRLGHGQALAHGPHRGHWRLCPGTRSQRQLDGVTLPRVSTTARIIRSTCRPARRRTSASDGRGRCSASRAYASMTRRNDRGGAAKFVSTASYGLRIRGRSSWALDISSTTRSAGEARPTRRAATARCCRARPCRCPGLDARGERRRQHGRRRVSRCVTTTVAGQRCRTSSTPSSRQPRRTTS